MGPATALLTPLLALALALAFGLVASLGQNRNRVRRRLAPTAGLARVSSQHGWSNRPGRLGLTLVMATLALVASVAVGVGYFGLVMVGALLAALGLARWTARLGAPARYERGLLDAIESLARHLRSGATISVALQDLAEESDGPVGVDLRRVLAAVQGGQLLGEALQDWSRRRARPSVGLVVACIAIGHEAGSLRGRHVDELAASLRQGQEAQREAAAWASQAQASALVMVAAPLAFAGLLASGDPAVRQFLLHSPLGLACLGVGLGLDLGAAAIMAHIVASVR